RQTGRRQDPPDDPITIKPHARFKQQPVRDRPPVLQVSADLKIVAPGLRTALEVDFAGKGVIRAQNLYRAAGQAPLVVDLIDVRPQLDLMSSTPLRRRKRYICESLKTARNGFRFFKIASLRCRWGKLKRETAMGQRVGTELARRDAGLDAQPIGAKYLVLQREEVGVLFQLGGGPLGQKQR